MVTLSNKEHILVVDDEEGIRLSLKGILEDEGYTVSQAENAQKALTILAQNNINLFILDIWLEGHNSTFSQAMDGMDLLKHIKAIPQYADIPVIMISGHGTIETAVSALRLGAYDFIEKPLALDTVINTVSRALEVEGLKLENKALRSALAQKDAKGKDELVGTSPQILAFKAALAAVAPTDVWVLITGENGTGKELAAKAVYKASKRCGEAFIAVNCAAIPEELIESELFGHERGSFTGADTPRIGKFELAHKGTLFLDEIGDMSLKTQAKILRILQEQRFERVGGSKTIEVDVRVIAATNKDLEQAMNAGTFRPDLYYRLRGFPLNLPPLRERKGDIPLLITALSRQISEELGLNPPLLAQSSILLLEQAQWRGNVRELRHLLEQLAIIYPNELIIPENIMEYLPSCLPVAFLEKEAGADDKKASHNENILLKQWLSFDYKKAKQEFETWYLENKLIEVGSNITKLSEKVGLERSYLHRKLKKST